MEAVTTTLGEEVVRDPIILLVGGAEGAGGGGGGGGGVGLIKYKEKIKPFFSFFLPTKKLTLRKDHP